MDEDKNRLWQPRSSTQHSAELWGFFAKVCRRAVEVEITSRCERRRGEYAPLFTVRVSADQLNVEQHAGGAANSTKDSFLPSVIPIESILWEKSERLSGNHRDLSKRKELSRTQTRTWHAATAAS